MCKSKLTFFILRGLVALALVIVTFTVNASCPKCNSAMNPGAEGGVCEKCGTIDSGQASEGVIGLCNVIIKILEDKPTQNKSLQHLLTVARQCVSSGPISLNEQSRNTVTRINTDFDIMQTLLQQSQPPNNNNTLNKLLSQRDIEVILALSNACGLNVRISRLYTTLLNQIGVLGIQRGVFRNDADLFTLVNESRFFVNLFYVLLVVESHNINPEFKYLTKNLHNYLNDLGDNHKTKMYRSLFQPICTDNLPKKPEDMESYKFSILYLLEDSCSKQYIFQWPEPNSYIYMLVFLNSDQTVSLFVIPGMGLLRIPKEELDKLLDKLRDKLKNILTPSSLAPDYLLGLGSLSLAAYQYFSEEQTTLIHCIPHLLAWTILFFRWVKNS